MVVILCSAGIEYVFGSNIPMMSEYNPITWIISGTVALREIKSVFENVESFTGTPLTSRLGLFEKLFNAKEKD